MLEENHYMDGRFQSTESQFKPAQKPKPKPEDDESQDSIVYDSQGWEREINPSLSFFLY